MIIRVENIFVCVLNDGKFIVRCFVKYFDNFGYGGDLYKKCSGRKSYGKLDIKLGVIVLRLY